ncbi:MAG: hypothetical protein MPW15_27965 [Candidatus Manganitrophus sp.]|nr:hypothetical protein [Candidatus Manganitrophus sp.]
MKPLTSLIIEAPASIARRATSDLVVSIEIGGIASCFASRSTTGTTRRISSSTETGVAPGRVDSPPMSIRSAPSPSIRSACSTA